MKKTKPAHKPRVDLETLISRKESKRDDGRHRIEFAGTFLRGGATSTATHRLNRNIGAKQTGR